MSANPYERRQLRRPSATRKGFSGDGMLMSDIGSMSMGRPARSSAITFEELEAIAWTAKLRGEREAADAAIDREQQARREAWAEGYTAGGVGGRVRLLEDIAEQHGYRVAKMRSRMADALEAVKADPRKVAKPQLVAMLEEAHLVLDRLMHSHHSGFDENAL